MERFILRNDQWERIKDMLPGKETDRGVTAKDNRLFLEAVFWVARTGAPWRDLPLYFGKWNSVYIRFSRWAKKGRWQRLFEAAGIEPDLEEVLMDSTTVRAHQHAAGAPNKEGPQALGRSRGGLSTKIHTVVDALGNPVRWRLTPGQRHDITQAPALLEGLKPQAVVADKAFDAQEFIESLEKTGAQAVIPPRDNRTETRDYDRHLYKDCNLVERFFNRIKHFRRIATRYEKLDRSYLAFLSLVCTFVWLL
jgi:transposase